MARKTRKFSEDVPFSLTSMMDMMTIILVFMIKNLDAEGQLLTQAENLISSGVYLQGAAEGSGSDGRGR